MNKYSEKSNSATPFIGGKVENAEISKDPIQEVITPSNDISGVVDSFNGEDLKSGETNTDSNLNLQNAEKPFLKKAEEKLSEITNWEDNDPQKLWVFTFKNKSERAIFSAFIIPPLVISIISMIHSVTFFELTNNLFLSWFLASAFEFASVSALFALTALSKIKKTTIWTLFGAIISIQIIANMYHSYINLNMENPQLVQLLSIIGVGAEGLPWTLRIIGFLQGGILPIIALSFVKATVEYLAINRKSS